MDKLKTNNRRCIVAPDYHHYKYCPSCEAYENEPRWKAMYCSLNCKNIFTACSEYMIRNMSAEDAKKILDSCDLSEFEKFHPVIKANINEINEVVKADKVTVNIDDTNVVETNVSDAVEVNVDESMTLSSRTKRRMIKRKKDKILNDDFDN